MFAETREQVRTHFLEVWRKINEETPMEPLEQLIAAIIERHPEYHDLLREPQRALDLDADRIADNPFLHMSLHIAIHEQLQTDRPPGVVAAYNALLATRRYDAHTVEHKMMDCLATSLRQAQVREAPPDESAYLACLRRLA